MDIASAHECLRQAEKFGAENSYILAQKKVVRTDTLDAHQIKSDVNHSSLSRLFVRIGAGLCSAVLEKDGFKPSQFEDIVAKCCQAARIARAWGQHSDNADADFKLFESEKVLAEMVLAGCGSDRKKSCVSDCFAEECLKSSASYLPESILQADRDIKNVAFHAQSRIEMIEKSLFLGKDIQTQRHFECALNQSLDCQNGSQTRIIHLPEYRLAGHKLDELAKSGIIDPRDIAEFFERTCRASEEFDFDAPGVLISAWGMNVLGHETSHLGVDITPGGRVVMNMSDCMNLPVQTGKCKSAGIRISLEGGLQKDELMKRLPASTLVVDAPDAWIRRNTALLDVRFAIVYSIRNGVFERAYRPVVLRFDLKRIWYYCRLASKPYVRMSLKCGGGMTDFQAPWAYFDFKPEPGHL